MTNLFVRNKYLYKLIVFATLFFVVCSIIMPILYRGDKLLYHTFDYEPVKNGESFIPKKDHVYYIVLPSQNYDSNITELKSTSRHMFHWKMAILDYSLSALMSRNQAFLILCFLYLLGLLASNISVIAFPLGGHAPPKAC